MDVLLTEEEQMLRNGAREFLEAESPPALARAMEKDELGYPADLWKQMGDLGWLGLAVAEEYGGQGATLTYLGIVLEEIGRAIAPVAAGDLELNRLLQLTARRAAGPVTHRPDACSAPVAVWASFKVRWGRPRDTSDRNPASSASTAARSGDPDGSTATSTPAACSRAVPPAARAWGSGRASTTRATPAAINASAHGGVRPWWAHGSNVT